jgi:uncharacterized protein (DUF2345 family)
VVAVVNVQFGIELHLLIAQRLNRYASPTDLPQTTEIRATSDRCCKCCLKKCAPDDGLEGYSGDRLGLASGEGVGLVSGKGLGETSGDRLRLASGEGVGFASGEGLGESPGGRLGLTSGEGVGLASGTGLGESPGGKVGLTSGEGVGLASGKGLGGSPGGGLGLTSRKVKELGSGEVDGIGESADGVAGTVGQGLVMCHAPMCCVGHLHTAVHHATFRPRS